MGQIFCPKTRVSPDTQQMTDLVQQLHEESERRHQESEESLRALQQSLRDVQQQMAQQLQQNPANDASAQKNQVTDGERNKRRPVNGDGNSFTKRARTVQTVEHTTVATTVVAVEQSGDLGHVGDIYDAKQFNLAYAGKWSTYPVYIRQETKELWDILQNDDAKYVYISGPPGTGKSTLVWAWVCHKSTEKKVLWLSFGIKCWDANCNYFENGSATHSSPRLDLDTTDELISSYQGNIIVVDGLDGNNIHNVSGALDHWLKHNQNAEKVVWASSHSAVLKERHCIEHGISHYTMCSWRKSDYTNALKNVAFLRKLCAVNEEVPDNLDGALAWLGKRFYTGGGSARWVFGRLSITHVQAIIAGALATQKDIDAFVNGTAGDQSEDTHNCLRAVYLDTTTDTQYHIFTSPFIMRKVVRKCEGKLIKAMTRFAEYSKNPSFDGWVFEYNFLHSVTSALRSSSGAGHIQVTQYGTFDVKDRKLTEEGGIERWDVISAKWFDNIDDVLAWDAAEFSNGMFFLPTKWNQGGFDVVYLQTSIRDVTKLDVWFIQIFRGNSHSLKLRFYDQMADAITRTVSEKIADIGVIFLTPSGKFFERITTATNDMGSLHGWKGNIKLVHFQRAR